MNSDYTIDVSRISGRTVRRVPEYPGEHGNPIPTGTVIGVIMRNSALCYVVERNGRIEEWFMVQAELIS